MSRDDILRYMAGDKPPKFVFMQTQAAAPLGRMIKCNIIIFNAETGDINCDGGDSDELGFDRYIIIYKTTNHYEMVSEPNGKTVLKKNDFIVRTLLHRAEMCCRTTSDDGCYFMYNNLQLAGYGRKASQHQLDATISKRDVFYSAVRLGVPAERVVYADNRGGRVKVLKTVEEFQQQIKLEREAKRAQEKAREKAKERA